MKNKVLRLVAGLLGTWLAAFPAVALERIYARQAR
jgi:hypothetical protein